MLVSKISFSSWLGFTLLGLIIGCASPKQKNPSPHANSEGPVDQLNMLAIPVALNFDQRPGPDGFVVKVYAGNRNRPRPVSILSGTLELLMYDGILKSPGLNTAKPRRTWKYTSEELQAHVLKSSIGICYQLAPQWGETKPLGEKISVVAHYTSPEGLSLYSAASVISVMAK